MPRGQGKLKISKSSSDQVINKWWLVLLVVTNYTIHTKRRNSVTNTQLLGEPVYQTQFVRTYSSNHSCCFVFTDSVSCKTDPAESQTTESAAYYLVAPAEIRKCDNLLRCLGLTRFQKPHGLGDIFTRQFVYISVNWRWRGVMVLG